MECLRIKFTYLKKYVHNRYLLLEHSWLIIFGAILRIDYLSTISMYVTNVPLSSGNYVNHQIGEKFYTILHKREITIVLYT